MSQGKREPTGVHDARGYSIIVATRTMTGRPKQMRK
jgi:hypothetical protein